MAHYEYTVNGLDGTGTPWMASGTVLAEQGNFREAADAALRESFLKLTQGKAVYNNPGQGGCHGPYTILSLLVLAQWPFTFRPRTRTSATSARHRTLDGNTSPTASTWAT